jgi:hypothetical protein
MLVKHTKTPWKTSSEFVVSHPTYMNSYQIQGRGSGDSPG